MVVYWYLTFCAAGVSVECSFEASVPLLILTHSPQVVEAGYLLV